MANLQKYEEWKPEQAVGEAEQVAATVVGGTTWKPKSGWNTIRILPTRRGFHPSPLLVTWNHWIEVPGRENGVGFNCPRLHKAGWSCPACKRFQELRSTGNPADFEAAGTYMPKQRVYANIIDRADEGAGVQVFAFGKTIYEPLMALRSTDPRQDVPFTDPSEAGCDILIKKEGEKKKTKYTVRASGTARTGIEYCPLSTDATQLQEWIDAIRNLTSEAHVLKTAEILKLLSGTSDDEPPPRRGGGGGGSAGRPRSVVDSFDDSGPGGYDPNEDD